MTTEKETQELDPRLEEILSQPMEQFVINQNVTFCPKAFCLRRTADGKEILLSLRQNFAMLKLVGNFGKVTPYRNLFLKEPASDSTRAVFFTDLREKLKEANLDGISPIRLTAEPKIGMKLFVETMSAQPLPLTHTARMTGRVS